MKGIKGFVRMVLKENANFDFDGCYFKLLGHNCEGKDIYLVFSNLGDEYGLCAKLATNNSSLQCDYEYDWADLISNGEYVGWSEENIDDIHKPFNLDAFCLAIEKGFNFAKNFNLED